MADWLLSDYDDPTWMVRNGSSGEIPIHFGVVLPDGTLLTEEVNSGFLDPIKRIVFEIRTGPLASVEDGVAQAVQARNLMIFASWLRMRNHFNFVGLYASIVREHVTDRAKGIEPSLSIVERVTKILQRYKSCPEDLPQPREILLLAGIHISLTKVPNALAAIREFRKEHGLAFLPAGERTRSPDKPPTKATLALIATSVRRLWMLRSRIGDSGLREDPFPEGPVNFAANIGAPDGRTATLSVDTVTKVVTVAERWLTIGEAMQTNVETRMPLVETLDHVDIRKTKLFSFDLRGEIATKELVTVKQVRRYFVPIACLCTAAVLSGRRGGEILEITSGAISGNEEEGYWLTVDKLKPLRRDNLTPCSPLVARAIALLERWSATARTLTNSDRLFLFPPAADGRIIKFRALAYLNDFARATGLSGTGDGQNWHFTVHQFRRAFVILMVWQFEIDIEPLAHHLGHFSLAMTFLYAQDQELRLMLSDERRIFTAAKLRAIVSDGLQVAGVFAKRFKALVDRFRRTIQVGDLPAVVRYVERLASEGAVILRGTAWGYCAARNTEVSRRRCACLQKSWSGGRVTDDGYPDPSGSSETTCLGCWHHLTDELRKPHWDRELEKVDRALASPGLPVVMLQALTDRRNGLASGVALLAKG